MHMSYMHCSIITVCANTHGKRETHTRMLVLSDD